MKKRKTGLVIFISVAAICIIYAVFMVLPSLLREKNTITLPPVSTDTPAFSDDSPEASPKPSTSAGITPENVQQIVSVMERSSNYWQAYTVTTPDGSEEVEVFRRADAVRVTVKRKNSVKNVIMLGNLIYIWYDNNNEVYQGVLGSDYTWDDEMHIPTYETLIMEDSASITEADYTVLFDHGEPCITAQVSLDSGRTERYWISTQTGLLIKYEAAENGKTTYCVTQTDAVSPVTSEELFTAAFSLPDGSYVE